MTLLITGAALLFIGIVSAVIGAFALSDERLLLKRRLTTSADDAVGGQLSVTLEDGILKQFESLVTPADEQERAKTRARLIRAGYRKPSAMRIYYASKAGLALGFLLVSVVVLALLRSSIPMPAALAILVIPPVLGNILPSFIVERNIQRRKEEAELGFPDTLDMLLVCIEVGLGVDQACRRVADQIGATYPVLAEELNVVNEELSAGKLRAAAFTDFADRLGVGDIKAFTTVLKQSDEFGVSIAETLRVYAADMRHKRVMRAEEKANLMPVKVAMGSIFFTVPPTMIIMAGPSMIMLLRAFGGHP